MSKRYITNDDHSVRMFENGLLERLSHVHPAVPHLIYLPVITVALLVASRRDVEPATSAMLFLGGLLAWTLAEYVIHRFLFHVTDELDQSTLEAVRNVPPGRATLPALTWKQRAYFLVHGVHHFFPNDSKRLVMPPSVSVPLAFGFYFAFRLLLGAALTPSFFAGFVAGYLIYDTTHYVVHHHRCRGRWSAYLKKLHMRHHYLDPDEDFGVSSPLWDFVLGTAGKRRSDARLGKASK